MPASNLSAAAIVMPGEDSTLHLSHEITLKCSLQTAQVPKQVQLRGSREKGSQRCLPEEGERFRMMSNVHVWCYFSKLRDTVLTHVSFREVALGHAKAKAKEQESISVFKEKINE